MQRETAGDPAAGAQAGLAAREEPAEGARPEMDLLRACARSRLDAGASTRIRTLAGREMDWNGLFWSARAHGVLPLLYRSLHATCPELVPADELARLRLHFHAGAQHNLLLARELFRLLEIFRTRHIDAVPLKGPVLAVAAYGNLSLRPFDDLDILLRDDNVLEAKSVLLSAGYRPVHPISDTAFRRVRYGLPFVREDGAVTIDPHWGFELYRGVIPRLFSTDEYRKLWERLQPVSLLGEEIPTLAAEDSLLILAVHGAKHTWETLKLVCDVAEVVHAHPELDWDAVLARAEVLRARRMLSLGLRLASDLLDAPLPDSVLGHVHADAAVGALAAQVEERLLAGGLPGSAEFPIIEPFHLKTMESAWDRCRYCLQIVMTPTVEDWVNLPLPAPLFPLYSILRPLRLAGKYGYPAWRRIARRARPM